MEKVASSLANNFSKNKSLQIYLITLTNQNIFFSLSKHVKLIQPSPRKINNFIFQSFATIVFLVKLMNKHNPDSTLSFGDRYNSIVIFSGLLASSKVIISNRQNPFLSNGLFVDTLNKWMYPYAHGLICQTQIAAKVIKEKYRIERIKLIPNPVNIQVDTANANSQRIVNVGRFGDQKNQFELVEIFDNVRNKENWELVFFGDGAKKDKTLDRISSLKLQGKIQVLPFNIAIDQEYLQSSIFAFTSRSEGFPNALAEAMSFGCACISYDCVAGPSDIIDNGVNGFLIPEGDSKMYAEKLSELINNIKLRTKFGTKGKEKMKRFESDKINQLYLSFILGE